MNNFIIKRLVGTVSRLEVLIDYGIKFAKQNTVLGDLFYPTSDEIMKDLDLSKKICLVTGANSGIGLEITRRLNAHKCTVLMACRNKYAASVVAKNTCINNHLLRFYEVNLASLRSVKNCIDDILKGEKKIDIVILNAATFGLPWILTEDKLETTFQVNYLSQFYLLMGIEKLLATDARVVFVSSESHRNINWTFDNKICPNEELLSLPEDHYTSIKAYNISKLCGILAMHYLSYRWLHTGKEVFCAHPGSFVKTRLCHNWWPYEVLYTFMKPFSKSVNQAACTPLYCATSPDLKTLSDQYYKDCKRCQESDLASDLQLSFRVYDITQNMLQERINAIDARGKALEEPARELGKDTIEETLVANYTGSV
ncbi:hypothetical protein K1T71_002649 [Dendrolimus kikuchii]|uniref:Uncharacterized protein n=1 Tax=Dendrolimus kikuchii TaxID=765133 RepID=A0ACC1DET1_9NEOP|nr:hypothetical protein K1T71_002649 [Dendrolimus kikuchii]